MINLGATECCFQKSHFSLNSSFDKIAMILLGSTVGPDSNAGSTAGSGKRGDQVCGRRGAEAGARGPRHAQGRPGSEPPQQHATPWSQVRWKSCKGYSPDGIGRKGRLYFTHCRECDVHLTTGPGGGGARRGRADPGLPVPSCRGRQTGSEIWNSNGKQL